MGCENVSIGSRRRALDGSRRRALDGPRGRAVEGGGADVLHELLEPGRLPALASERFRSFAFDGYTLMGIGVASLRSHPPLVGVACFPISFVSAMT